MFHRLVRPFVQLFSAVLLVLLSVLTLTAPVALAAGPNCTVVASGGTYPTIQAAVNDSGCTTISVAAGTYTENVTIGRNVTITGATGGSTIVDGNNAGSVFKVTAGTVTLANLTIRNGSGTDNGTGSIFGGGIYNAGTLTVTNSTLSGNRTNYGAGGVYNRGTLTVTNSTLSGNSASTVGGGIYNDATLTVTNSTLSGNSAGSYGGGIDNLGTLTLTNSTLSGNSAYYGGGIFNATTSTLVNSIVANAPTGGACQGTAFTTSSHNNLLDAASNACGLTNGTNGNIIGSDPLLGPLANNGGPTQTFALLAGSPAIDAGDDATCAAAPVSGKDQRGSTRPQGAHCDIGAYEIQATIRPVVTVSFPTPNGSNGFFTTNSTTGSVSAVGQAGITSITCTGTGVTVGALVGGGTVSASAPLTVSGQGTHTVTCLATDSAGQSGFADGSQNTATVKIDSVAPDTTITSGPSDLTSSLAATFTFSGSDSTSHVASYQCALDSGSFTACTSPQTYSEVASGSHTFQVRAIDGAGNVDPTPTSYTWTSSAVSGYCSTSGKTETCTYTYTGAAQTWTAPAGLTEATFDVYGAEGGSDTSAHAGLGGRATTTINIVPGARYQITVGGQGSSGILANQPSGPNQGGVGGFNGGGGGSGTEYYYIPGSGGGGASDVRASDFTLAERIITAGGGGGRSGNYAVGYGGAYNGGSGGGTNGGSGGGSDIYSSGGGGGGGGTQTGGGTGGTPSYHNDKGIDGSLGQGGSTKSQYGPGAGGGGGGYFGGGGGGGGSFGASGGGGGGGSGYGPVGTTFESGVRMGNGLVTITYQDTVAPDTTITGQTTDTSGTSFTFTSTDADSGVVRFECNLDDGAFAACTSPQRYTSLSVSTHIFQVRAIDVAGNVDPTPASTTTVAASAPCYQIVSALDGRLLTLPDDAQATPLVAAAAQAGNALQLWKLRADGAIVSLRTGYLLDVNGAVTAPSTAAIVYPELIPAQANQRWTLAARENGQVAIMTQMTTSYVLDINGSDGVHVILYPEDVPAEANQRWTLAAQTSATCSAATVPTPTATATATSIPTNTPLPTATNTPMNTPTATATSTSTPLPTATATSTNTPVPPTATATATNTPVPPTATATATNTPLPTSTTTNTPMPPTATATATNTPVPPTATATATSTSTTLPTSTNTPVPPTSTPLPPTSTPLPTAVNTPLPSVTNTPLPTGTAISTSVPPTATSTNTPLPTTMPTNTATNTLLPTATATSTSVPPTATLTKTPLPSATSTTTPVPPTATATVTKTPLPSATATRTSIPQPTATTSPVPTSTPTNGSILDTFNRATGKVGSNWNGLTGDSFYRIASNQLDVEAGGPLIWKTAFATNQEAFVTLSTIDTNSPSQGVLLKVQADSAADAGAISVVYDAVAKGVRVSTLRVGAKTWTLYPTKAVTFANGDVLKARALANGTVQIFKNGTLVTTVTLNTADGTFFNAKGGRIGIWTVLAPKAVLDDFGGGTLAASSAARAVNVKDTPKLTARYPLFLPTVRR